MQVRVSIRREIVVDGKVDAFDIDTTAKDVGSNTDALVEVLELLVAANTLLLGHAGVDSDGGEVALAQELVEFSSTLGALDKDDDLVELELVQKIIKLTVLLTLFQLDIILLKTVEGELGVLINIVLGRVLHELLADGLDIVRQGGGEHHDLLLLGSGAEDLLDVTTHV